MIVTHRKQQKSKKVILLNNTLTFGDVFFDFCCFRCVTHDVAVNICINCSFSYIYTYIFSSDLPTDLGQFWLERCRMDSLLGCKKIQIVNVSIKSPKMWFLCWWVLTQKTKIQGACRSRMGMENSNFSKIIVVFSTVKFSTTVHKVCNFTGFVNFVNLCRSGKKWN